MSTCKLPTHVRQFRRSQSRCPGFLQVRFRFDDFVCIRLHTGTPRIHRRFQGRQPFCSGFLVFRRLQVRQGPLEIRMIGVQSVPRPTQQRLRVATVQRQYRGPRLRLHCSRDCLSFLVCPRLQVHRHNLGHNHEAHASNASYHFPSKLTLLRGQLLTQRFDPFVSRNQLQVIVQLRK